MRGMTARTATGFALMRVAASPALADAVVGFTSGMDPACGVRDDVDGRTQIATCSEFLSLALTRAGHFAANETAHWTRTPCDACSSVGVFDALGAAGPSPLAREAEAVLVP